MERAVMCPQCNAPLAPHRFARSIVCSYCGATVQIDEASISAAIFNEAFRVWNSPETYHFPSWISIGDRHWAMGRLISRDDTSDVYAGQLARWPTELVAIKLLRDRKDVELVDNEWDVLQALHKSDAPGADSFTALLPQPVLHGDITAGSFAGRRVTIFRRAIGFRYSFDAVIRAYPQGIPPRASIWIWRRILEVLSFVHASGIAHGAVVPAHLLVQENEHGVRLVGYTHAGRLNEKLRTGPPGNESFYPQPAETGSRLTAQLDLALSARCIIALLGGNPQTAALPPAVPAQLAEIIQRVALSKPAGTHSEDAWTIREELGEIAKKVFGPPQFIPIIMPS